jgi:hypothetical protein
MNRKSLSTGLISQQKWLTWFPIVTRLSLTADGIKLDNVSKGNLNCVKMMEKLMREYENSPTIKVIRVLLFNNYRSGELRHQLEATGKFDLINNEDMNIDEMALFVRVKAPDIILFCIDVKTPLKFFRDTLIVLQKLQMNLKTVILADNPLVYLEYALKTGVAALLHRQMDLRDLILVMQEIYAWYQCLPKPCESLACSTNLVLRINQEVDDM